MFRVSNILNTAPETFKNQLQELTYQSLAKLRIPFERIDTDEAITMEDCLQINHQLDMQMVKTLFLCNRQQTEFYLFVTTAGKAFKSKDFSNALGIARVSFAPAELMESMLGVKIGAATVFGVLLDKGCQIQVIFDRDVATSEWYGCSDGTTTCYMKIKTTKILHDFLSDAKHLPRLIEV